MRAQGARPALRAQTIGARGPRVHGSIYYYVGHYCFWFYCMMVYFSLISHDWPIWWFNLLTGSGLRSQLCCNFFFDIGVLRIYYIKWQSNLDFRWVCMVRLAKAISEALITIFFLLPSTNYFQNISLIYISNFLYIFHARIIVTIHINFDDKIWLINNFINKYVTL